MGATVQHDIAVYKLLSPPATGSIFRQYFGPLPSPTLIIHTLPSTLSFLSTGIGPYTAGAISSIAFNRVEPLVDGNVIRVLSRLYALQEPVGSFVCVCVCVCESVCVCVCGY